MADEEKKKIVPTPRPDRNGGEGRNPDQSVGEEETTEETEHKFNPNSDECGVCGGCGGEE